MNIVKLNTVALDNAIIKKGSGGGGVPINNQEKSLEITENGVTEVTADAGFTGLSKVVVNTNVQSGGGGGVKPKKDGKTYLYITIPPRGQKEISFVISTSNSVDVDWGDSGISQFSAGANISCKHLYKNEGSYVICVDTGADYHYFVPNSNSLIGSSTNNPTVISGYLDAVEYGHINYFPEKSLNSCMNVKEIYFSEESIDSIGQASFRNCYSLQNINLPQPVKTLGTAIFAGCTTLRYAKLPKDIEDLPAQTFYGCSFLTEVNLPESIKTIGDEAFYDCKAIEKLQIPMSVTTLGKGVFQDCSCLKEIHLPNISSIPSKLFASCSSLPSIFIPASVQQIDTYAFQYCYGLVVCDMSSHESVPSLGSTNAFSGVPTTTKIIVPDALYDEWVSATNWSSMTSRIIKKSDWDAQNS